LDADHGVKGKSDADDLQITNMQAKPAVICAMIVVGPDDVSIQISDQGQMPFDVTHLSF